MDFSVNGDETVLPAPFKVDAGISTAGAFPVAKVRLGCILIRINSE